MSVRELMAFRNLLGMRLPGFIESTAQEARKAAGTTKSGQETPQPHYKPTGSPRSEKNGDRDSK